MIGAFSSPAVVVWELRKIDRELTRQRRDAYRTERTRQVIDDLLDKRLKWMFERDLGPLVTTELLKEGKRPWLSR